MNMNSKVYKWCAVPQCKNTSVRTPNKIFVYVPHDKTKRNKWFKLARRDLTSAAENSQFYFCEDHFDLPNDMANYMEYHVMGYVSQVRMKPGCVPTKFDCLSRRKKRASTGKGTTIPKKQRKDHGEVSCSCSVSINEAVNNKKKTQRKPKKACQANLIQTPCIETTLICNRYIFKNHSDAEIQVNIAPKLIPINDSDIKIKKCCKRICADISTTTESKYFAISTTTYEPLTGSRECIPHSTVKKESSTEIDELSEISTFKNEPSTEIEETETTLINEQLIEIEECPESSSIKNEPSTEIEEFSGTTVKNEPSTEI